MLLALALAPLAGCGYHVGAKGDLLPKGIHSIAIPAFATFSTQYKLTDVLPRQIAREFRARSRFEIVDNPSQADAVLTGSVNQVQLYPVIFDPTSGKATRIVLLVQMTITLREQSTGKTLFSRPNYTYKQYFDVAVDPHQYFDESGPALDRLSADVARDVVSAILENF
jgi:outer membrane lipopolysaccharide assembly protein LptE/RlpB